jgi:hypothetical protein
MRQREEVQEVLRKMRAGKTKPRNVPMGKKRAKQGNEWLEAKRLCGLSDEDVRMAKELGFKPRSLIKNIPSRSQRWKAPVREWIRDLYAKRFGETRGRGSAENGSASPNPPTGTPPA